MNRQKKPKRPKKPKQQPKQPNIQNPLLRTRFWYTARVTYLILAIAVLIVSMLQGGRIIGGLLALVLLLLPVGGLYALILCRQVKYSHKLEHPVCTRLEPVRYRCEMRNTGPLSVSYARVRMDADRTELMRPAVWIAAGTPFQTQIWETTLSPVHRGRYSLKLVRTAVSDPFGLFRLPTVKPANVELTALPRLLEIPDGWRRVFDTLLNGKKMSHSTDTPAVESRKYRYGDSMRRIHWKLTARHGEIMVREYEGQGEPQLLCILDTSPINMMFAPYYEDTLIEAYLAMIRYALSRRVTVTAAYGSGIEAVNMQCANLHDFGTIRHTMASVAFDSEVSFSRLLSDSDKDSGVMIFTARPLLEDLNRLLSEDRSAEVFLLDIGHNLSKLQKMTSCHFHITPIYPNS